MNIDFVGRSNIHLDQELREFATGKLQKVQKFLEEPIEIHLTLEVEKHRQIADIHLSHRHGVLQAREETDAMLDAIRLVSEKIEKQARRSHKKFLDKKRRSRPPGGDWAVDIVEASSLGEGNEPAIIESNMIQVKPMTIEEAALKLEASNHEFLVFRDSGSERVSVLYRRRDSNYGLISPDS